MAGVREEVGAASRRAESSPIPHEPALDGLRGLAVAAVLLFHAGYGWAKGGYLGVSLFFTLSGFLISRLLMAEHDRLGTVRLRRFWVRRARRLWPASLLTLAGIMVLARAVFSPTELPGFRVDVLTAVGQVANWRFIFSGRSYADLFASPSLVQHFWSLAIEEQLYLVLPLVLLAALRLRRRWAVAAVIGALMAASMVTTIAFRHHSDRVYYGTDTRSFELLAGVMLAIWLRARPERPGSRSPLLTTSGWVALALSLGAWATVAQSRPIVAEGGLWCYALLSVVLIAAARGGGSLNRVLRLRPLEQLGRISYGVYLLHWPVFQWLSPERLGVGRTFAFTIATAVTISAATLSFVLLEQPIRLQQARWLHPAPRPTFAAGAAFIVVLIAIPTLAPMGRPSIDFEDVSKQLADAGTVTTPSNGTPKVGFFGDSTALTISFGFQRWTVSDGSGKAQWAPGAPLIGCGLVTAGIRHSSYYPTGPVPERCKTRDQTMRAGARGLDLAVYVGGIWDIAGYTLPGEHKVRSIASRSLGPYLMAQAERVYADMASGARRVAWVLVPDVEEGRRNGRSPAHAYPESNPELIGAYNLIGHQLAERHPDLVLIDLRGWLEKQPGGMLDPKRRPDGVHFTTVTATDLAREFLGQAVLDALR